MPPDSPHWRFDNYTKKRESHTVARSANGGSGIAHHCRTSKLAEASRRICVKTPTADAHAPAAGGIYISTRHLLFAAFLTVIEIYQISVCQERASSKRFQNVCRPSRVAHDRASAVRSASVNLAKFPEMSKN